MGQNDFFYAGGGGAAAGGGAAIQISGNTSGTTALVSSGTLVLQGGTNITLSQNGNTIQINGPANVTNSFWRPVPVNPSVTAQMGNSSLFFAPAQQYGYLTATVCNLPISFSLSSSSNSSHAGAVSVAVGIYTRSGGTLNSLSSGSTFYQWTDTAGQSSASLTGPRWLTVPINVNMTPGDYYVAFWSATTSTNANWYTLSNLINTALPVSSPFMVASSTNAQILPGFGNYTQATGALLSSVAINALSATNSRDMFFQAMYFANITA